MEGAAVSWFDRITLTVAAVLVVAGVALVSVPAALVTAGCTIFAAWNWVGDLK